MAGKCGFSAPLFSLWKKGAQPELSTIKKISDATGYPISFFIDPDTLSENTIGEKVYKYRTLSGMTRSELAEKVCLDESTIKDYENNKFKGNSQETVNKIYEAIGLKPK
ncbi:helix-turn-helix domain-containing protein [Lutispora sp.]|uniref:helix-turn-helix domain-containing protein n=1 Tax=Lutispora sp. TaxID=2828727 RepID=UPI002B203BD7|nr:helix-turn-helix transcriptional regulator [Lutispora sp.]MEA4962920.1 helix-turn-helix transcriptional regulator [Lutispora sp.]